MLASFSPEKVYIRLLNRVNSLYVNSLLRILQLYSWNENKNRDWCVKAAMESLVSGAICGITYHMFAGQPLTVIGSTGPVLVFETIVYKFCK